MRSGTRPSLLDAAGHGLLAIDLEGTIVLWNRAAERIYGWSAAEATGRPCASSSARVTSSRRRSIRVETAAGRSWAGDCWVVRRDGSRFQVHVTTTPVFDGESRLVALILVASDSFERRAGDDARRMLAAIVDGSGDAILTVSTGGIVMSWNPAAESLFGYEASEIIGRAVSVLAPPDRLAEQLAMRARLIAGGPPEQVETVRVRKDGSVVEVLVTVSRRARRGREHRRAVGDRPRHHRDVATRSARWRRASSGWPRRSASRTSAASSSTSSPRELTWSDEYYRILGLDPTGAATPELFMSMVHPDDLPAVARRWTDAIRAWRAVRPRSSGSSAPTAQQRSVAPGRGPRARRATAPSSRWSAR